MTKEQVLTKWDEIKSWYGPKDSVECIQMGLVTKKRKDDVLKAWKEIQKTYDRR